MVAHDPAGLPQSVDGIEQNSGRQRATLRNNQAETWGWLRAHTVFAKVGNLSLSPQSSKLGVVDRGNTIKNNA